jgi:hypothetical protein
LLVVMANSMRGLRPGFGRSPTCRRNSALNIAGSGATCQQGSPADDVSSATRPDMAIHTGPNRLVSVTLFPSWSARNAVLPVVRWSMTLGARLPIAGAREF